jgi:hypothetical protein
MHVHGCAEQIPGGSSWQARQTRGTCCHQQAMPQAVWQVANLASFFKARVLLPTYRPEAHSQLQAVYEVRFMLRHNLTAEPRDFDSGLQPVNSLQA